ncbi:HAMP domain-containing protein [Altericroceibacterium spongiae]|uniref:histidine kinase n=1 Tax=Altericroceibacterium spongiae TaxID=2320269 RepID=A0A420EC77_9SPHN|nr:ATP-binding protein [Altericroceibacterium spongiae]RKF18288.1 HAMP domain-containing protein [Altericroceibacterium spongiae]
MKRIRLWPRGLTGRVMIVLLVAILVEFAGTLLLFGEAERLLLRSGQAHRVAEQLVVADRVLRLTPRHNRPYVAPSLSTRHVRFALQDNAPKDWRATRLSAVAEKEIMSWEPSLQGRVLQLGVTGVDGGKPNRLIGALQMENGGWIYFQSREAINRWNAPFDWLVSLLFLVAAVLLVSALLVRTLGAPLRALSAATDNIGFARRKIMIESSGPQELRRLADAFNAMQDRIEELLESRTQALLAVSHDLRTPLSRLKLRLHGRMHPEDPAAMRADVEEMQAMLDSLLEYLGGGDGTRNDPPTRTNIAALIQTIASNAEEAGHDVRWQGPPRLEAIIQISALGRAITNLVENAVKYGERADIHYFQKREEVVIEIRDRGPGIPEDMLPLVTEPFFRADTARARDTKGLGLGLSVVDRIVALHGGSLELENTQSGLIARMRLPIEGISFTSRLKKEDGNILIRF